MRLLIHWHQSWYRKWIIRGKKILIVQQQVIANAVRKEIEKRTGEKETDHNGDMVHAERRDFSGSACRVLRTISA